MILVNGVWENSDTLYDISEIIRTHYNRELANRLDELIEDVEWQQSQAERAERLEYILEEIGALASQI